MEKQKLYIWDDPESKLRFLDMVMRGQRWEASVIIPDEMRDDQSVGELKRYLRDNGYSVSLEKDIYRNDVLNVTHLGNSAGLFEHLHHFGLVQGTHNSISDLGSALSRALIRGKQYMKNVTSSSARTIGGVYLVGDATILASGLFNKEKAHLHHNESWLKGQIEELKTPYNQLQLFQGASTFIQSLIYMQYARDGQEILLHDLNHHLEKADKNGRNPLDTSSWLEESGKKSVIEQTENFLRKNAITVGALTMIAGQFAYMTGGAMRIAKWQKQININKQGALGADVLDQLEHFLEKKPLSITEKLNKKRNAGIWEIGRGAFSTATWSMFMKDPIHTENKADWKSHPLLRLKQEALENPQRPAAAMSAISSSFGALAGSDKGNPVQMAGELTYLIADAMMFVTKKHDYGKENASRDDQMIEAATHLIQSAPFAIGENERATFIADVARYMIEENDRDNGTKTENPEQRVDEITQGVVKALINQETAFERITAKAATLIDKLPRYSQKAITTKLSKTLSQLNSIHATAEELETSINKHRIEHVYSDPNQSFSMARIIPDMVSLIYAIPGFQSAENAIAIYELFERTYQTSPEEREQLTQEMQQVAQQAVEFQSKQETPSAQIHAAQLQTPEHQPINALQ